MPKLSSTFRVEVEYANGKKENRIVQLNHEATEEYAAKVLADHKHFPDAVHMHVTASDATVPANIAAGFPAASRRPTISTSAVTRDSDAAKKLADDAEKIAADRAEDNKHRTTAPQEAITPVA